MQSKSAEGVLNQGAWRGGGKEQEMKTPQKRQQEAVMWASDWFTISHGHSAVLLKPLEAPG